MLYAWIIISEDVAPVNYGDSSAAILNLNKTEDVAFYKMGGNSTGEGGFIGIWIAE
jgi:hypothetical protein